MHANVLQERMHKLHFKAIWLITYHYLYSNKYAAFV